MTHVRIHDGTRENRALTWLEVSEVHRVRNGIYQRNGRLISLLTDFGKINPCYPDVHGDTTETIHYTGSGRRGDQKLDVAKRTAFGVLRKRSKSPAFDIEPCTRHG